MASKGANKSQKNQSVPEFTEDEARAYIERMMWPDGPVCRHCGSVNVYRMQGATARPGLLRCRDCDKQFTVTVGTVMEDSHLPLSVWVKAIHMMASSKKGVSALQLQRNLGLGSYRTAWHLAHRVRLAMHCEPLNRKLHGVIEADETYIGARKPRIKGVSKRGRGTNKQPVMVLVERDGKAHSQVIADVSGETLKGAIRQRVSKKATICTDENNSYNGIGFEFDGGHLTVNHRSEEYVNPKTGAFGAVVLQSPHAQTQPQAAPRPPR